MRTSWRALAALAGVLAGTLVACGSESSDRSTVEATPDQTVNVTMTDLAFEPTEIRVGASTDVRLSIRNQGALSHDFTIVEMPHGTVEMTGDASSDDHAHGSDERAVHVVVAPGTEATVDLETTEAGTFEFFCSVDGHREAGMSGSFVVR